MMGGNMGRRNTGESMAAKPKRKVEVDAGGRDFFGNLVGVPDKLEAIHEIEFMPSVTKNRKNKTTDDYDFEDY